MTGRKIGFALSADLYVSKLFEPLTLRGLTVKNRVWVAPMCQYMVERRDGTPTPWHLVHLGARPRVVSG